jgi:hypothetical protein
MTQVHNTIRNIDQDVLREARIFSIRFNQTLGITITEALEYYFHAYDDEDEAETTSN